MKNSRISKLAMAALLLCCGAALPAMVRSPRAAQPHPPGYLGIVFHDASGHGVEVVMVDHDGPAGKVGLRPHDLILSLNGQPIASADALSRMIHETAPGKSVKLTVQREGAALTVNVQLADRLEVERSVRAKVSASDTEPSELEPLPGAADTLGKDPTPASAVHSSFLGTVLHSTPFTGLGLQTMEPQLAEYFGDTQGFGLLVQMVVPNSPAALCGLRAGDVVLRADTVALRSAADWNKRLRGSAGEPMLLNVLRDKREITVKLTPETRHHSLLEWPQMEQTFR